jgi:spore germination protein KC
MIFGLTACWGSKDLTEYSILNGLGVDKQQDEKIQFTVQILKPSAAKSGGTSGGGGAEKSFVVMSNTEQTIFAAIRGMLKKLDKKIYHSPAPIIVIGEKFAKQGITDVIDYVLRDHETQYKALIVVAKETTARKILEQKYELSKAPGTYLADTLKNYDSNAFTEEKMLLNVAKDLVAEGKALTLPVISISEEMTQTEGVAVFSKDKLIGYLDKYETRGYMFAMGRVESTIVEVDNPSNNQKKMAIEVTKASVKNKIDWSKEDSPKFKIKIEIKGKMGDQRSGADVEEEKLVKLLEQSCNESVKQEVMASIAKCQKEYKCDVFGFGKRVFDEKPQYWKKVKDQWSQDIYPNVEVEVKVDTKLSGTGLIGKSLEVK